MSSAPQASNTTTACAIRWDAWYSNGPNDPSRYTAAALSLPPFHGLAPVHARFDENGRIEWAASQSTFDAEIRTAHGTRLCWAYLMYGKNNVIDLSNPMLRGLAFHRASTLKRQVNYAMMVTTSLIGRTGAYVDSTHAIVNLIKDSNYQKVEVHRVKRPLLFIYYEEADLEHLFAGSLPAMKQAVDGIRHASVSLGLGNPYIVVVLSPAKAAEIIRVALGADAITEYVAGIRTGGVESWAIFEPTIEADWNAYAAAGIGAMVPTISSGADIRARCQSPPPYDHRFPTGFDCDHFYIQNPTLSELETESRHMHAWINDHSSADPANLLLIYAWSECDESGNCLMPTYADPNGSKLRAIMSAFR